MFWYVGMSRAPSFFSSARICLRFFHFFAAWYFLLLNGLGWSCIFTKSVSAAGESVSSLVLPRR
ncbi:hypothetical protein BC940DRAFT_305345, partial [Gongronella butleri]